MRLFGSDVNGLACSISGHEAIVRVCWLSARRCPSTALQVAPERGRANAAPLAAESLQAEHEAGHCALD